MAIMILKKTQAETMKAQLSDLLISISWADLAKRYFNRSGSWLYHKLDGSVTFFRDSKPQNASGNIFSAPIIFIISRF